MPACKCSERKKPANRRKWRILQYKCNHSAFNGWRYTRSDYSEITCLRCRMGGEQKQIMWNNRPGIPRANN